MKNNSLISLIKVFGRMVPAFKGLGYAMVVVRFFVNIYYVVITAWSLYYLCIGFQSELPWGSCEEDYNTFKCYSLKYERECQTKLNSTGESGTFYAKKCVTYDEYCNIFGDRTYQPVVENNITVSVI